MKNKYAALCMFVGFFFINALPASAQTVPMCLIEGSDSDGDGWGWENEASCRVGIYNPITFPVCESIASDSDGDGWGWENETTCLVASPGDDIENAGRIELNQDVTSIISAGGTHYYSFEITETTGVTAFVISDIPFDYEITIESQGSVFFYEDFVSLEPGVCLAPGTYNLRVSRFGFESSAIDRYTASVATETLPCIAPSDSIADQQNSQWFLGDDGYLYQATDFELSRLDRDGNTIWSVDVGDFVHSIQTVESGGLLLFNSFEVAFIDDNGGVVWSHETFFPIFDYELGGTTLVINDDFHYTVLSLALEDGSVRWRYDYPLGSPTDIVGVSEDDTTYVSTGSELLIFD